MLLVNSATVNCGVYQYGKRLWNSINKNSVMYKYVEISTSEEFLDIDSKPKIILFPEKKFSTGISEALRVTLIALSCLFLGGYFGNFDKHL